jgi:hypothetical protein
MGAALKWVCSLSTFILNKMCEIISNEARTHNAFKEMYLNDVAKLVLEFCDTKVHRTQVYNHMIK